jgi:HAD superfamily hydrolase (TIGR01509 family)
MKTSYLFWDNDGVLVDTESIYFEVTREVLRTVGLELTRERYQELFLRQGRGAWHLVTEQGRSADEVRALREVRNDRYRRRLEQDDVAVEGARQALEALRGRMQMAVVTSSRRDHFQTIHRRTGFSEFFEFVLAREDYVDSKPSPEPYLAALSRAGVEPCRCLAIEDSPRGLASAKAAGLACWIIPGPLTLGESFAGADRIVADIREIPDLLMGVAGA